jgi:hypothetical protein
MDHECKPMQVVQVAQGVVNCNAVWPIVCQGEVEDATPGQGKNTTVICFPCIWVTHLKHKLDRKA